MNLDSGVGIGMESSGGITRAEGRTEQMRLIWETYVEGSLTPDSMSTLGLISWTVISTKPKCAVDRDG